MHQSEWDNFLNDFDPKTLSRLILQDEKQLLTEATLNKALEDITYRAGHPIRDKAIAYCLSPEYWAIRDQSGEYKSLLARLLGSWVAYSKKDKQLALKDYWRPFLLSDSEMTLDGLKAFITQKVKETPDLDEKEINQTTSRILSILLDGELGLSIVKPALGEIAVKPQATTVKIEEVADDFEMVEPAVAAPAIVAPPTTPKSSSWFNFFSAAPVVATPAPVVSEPEEEEQKAVVNSM